MGYETKIIIGKSGTPSPQIEIDKSKPFGDGSGFEYKRDKRGNWVYTGKLEFYFMPYAEIDLCKLGYQDDALNALQAKSHDSHNRENLVYYFYHGNEKVTEDCYGSPMYPVPIADVLEAMKKSIDKTAPYRRLTWAVALLESMSKDSEKLEVMFYGH